MRHELDIWIIGGDRRQVRLAGLLAEDGHTVHTLGLGPAGAGVKEERELTGAALADCVVLPLPVAAPGGKLNAPLAEEPLTLEGVFAALRPGQVICAGRVDPATQAVAGDRGLVLHDYFAREELAVANAVPTVLGIGHRNRHITFPRPPAGLEAFCRKGERVMCPVGSTVLRVAAYCRVSTDKEDQRNSLAAQRDFFQGYIRDHPGWTLVAIFADEGLSGTSVRRPQFSRMLRRAMDGEIDLILTKEVSRFARNTVDTLQTTRRLKERGVGVCFLNDNIDTREDDGEFRLTIMASVAQEESRKISERTRWGQLQAMRRGVVFGNDSIYGYTLRGGRLTVEPEQAAVVSQIYRIFLTEHKGAHAIARMLTQAGVPPPLRSDGVWSANTVLGILRNEKYCGDLLQKKYRTTDHLTHRKVVNDGTEERFCLRDHHEAIVSRADFQAVQAELARRAGLKEAGSRFSARYWYSGKIRCGACGRSFTLKRTRRADGTEYTRFVCRGRLAGSDTCRMPSVRGEVLLAAVRAVWKCLPLDRPGIEAEVLRALEAPEPDGREAERLRQALLRQEGRRDRAAEAYLDGVLDRAQLRRLLVRWEGETARLRGKLAALEAEERGEANGERIRAAKDLVRRELEGGEILLDELVRQVTVVPDGFLVEAAELPVRFRVRAVGEGTGQNYRVRVTECCPVPFDEEGQTAQ